MNIKSRMKLAYKFCTILQNSTPVHTAHTHDSGARAVQILAWEGNSFVFGPLQVGEKRETVNGLF